MNEVIAAVARDLCTTRVHHPMWPDWGGSGACADCVDCARIAVLVIEARFVTGVLGGDAASTT